MARALRSCRRVNVPTTRSAIAFRQPDWRWRHIIEHIECQCRQGKFDDCLRVTLPLLRRVRRRRDQARIQEQRARIGELAWALRRNEEGGLPLCELQARILAGQSTAAIARRWQARPECVELYESLFFDVRGRLKSEAWIRHFALQAHADPRKVTDVGDLWLQAGYYGGAVVLDALLNALPEAIRYSAVVTDYLTVEVPLKIRAYVVAKSAPLSEQRNVVRVIEWAAATSDFDIYGPPAVVTPVRPESDCDEAASEQVLAMPAAPTAEVDDWPWLAEAIGALAA